MEYNDKMKEETYRLIMVVSLWIGIILFLLAIILLSKNIDEIKTDPIIYGMEKHYFSSCSCYSNNGEFTTITLDDFKINN